MDTLTVCYYVIVFLIDDVINHSYFVYLSFVTICVVSCFVLLVQLSY